jgi:hypothetical protein
MLRGRRERFCTDCLHWRAWGRGTDGLLSRCMRNGIIWSAKTCKMYELDNEENNSSRKYDRSPIRVEVAEDRE